MAKKSKKDDKIKQAKISIDYNEDNSTVILSGSYDDVITALCAGIKGLVVNMYNHPKYAEIRKNSDMSDEEFIDEITYSVIVNIMERLDQHQVLSINDNGNNNKDVMDLPTDVETPTNSISEDMFNAFEEFTTALDKESNIENE